MGSGHAKKPTPRTSLEITRRDIPRGALWHTLERDQFDEKFFDPDYWSRAGGDQLADGGRGNTMIVPGPDKRWVLRHYRRGGWAAPLLGDLYWYTGEARTRAAREFAILCDLWRDGLPVPCPVAARYRRSGVYYRADLLTELIDHATAWSRLLLEGRGRDSQFAAVGAAIRMLHDHDVYHADLNAHNILVDRDERVSFVDFDRARRRSAGAWRDKNLLRLERSLIKIGEGRADVYSVSHWRALVTAYHA